MREMGIEVLPILPAHAIAAAGLPRHHGDPFDRMLVAQARLEGLVLATIDATIRRYDAVYLGTQPNRMAEILAKAGTTNEVLPGDEIPEGWLESTGSHIQPDSGSPKTHDFGAMVAEAVHRNIPNLATARLGREYGYHSLPLCVIDAVFSIGVHYRNAQKAVESWCASQKPVWPIYAQGNVARSTIGDMIEASCGLHGEALTDRFFGGNRQRTSPRSGILKADAVLLFAAALRHAGVDDFTEIRNETCVLRAEQAIMRIDGQRSGISFRSFMMLAGDESSVKPDRMIRRFVADAVGRDRVPPSQAATAVVEACAKLTHEFPNLTPRLLDHLIWDHQRQKGSLAAA